jgi:predicted dehydrogenase
MPTSIGVVGLGQFGRHFIGLFRDHPLVERVALCDLSAERLAACSNEFGIAQTYSSLDAICRSDLDALVIITQHWMHFEHVMQALAAGKHVYSAVPPAYSTGPDQIVDKCGRLVEAVKRSGLIYMLGETTVFRPETVYCRRRAAPGDFGRFVYSEGEYLHDWSHGLLDVYKNRWGADFGPDKLGDPPMFYPTHSTSGVIEVTGAHMTHVSAFGYVHPYDEVFRPDTIYANPMSNQVALYRMSDGSTARICEFRRVGHPGREGLRIYGTEASFEWDVSGARWVTKGGWEPVDVEQARETLPDALASGPDGHGGSHAYLVHEFVDSVANNRLPRTNVWQAVRYMLPGVMAHASALRDGERLEIPDFGDPLSS